MTDTNTNSNQNQGANANQGNDGGNANQGGGNSQENRGANQNNNNGADNNANRNNNTGGDQGAGGGEDYKAKFTASSTEAQRMLKLLTDNGIDPKTGKKVEGNNSQSNNNANGNDPAFFTDADLEATFPSFATMSDDEKTVLRQVGSFPKMARMVAEMYDKSTFTEQLEVLKADPANKLIADNEKEFKAYAYKDGNLKLPIEVLVDAFIGKKLREGAGGGNNNGNQNNQGNANRGMEDGSAGAGAGNNSGIMEITAEQAREMRTKDPKKYAKLAASKKLKIVSN